MVCPWYVSGLSMICQVTIRLLSEGAECIPVSRKHRFEFVARATVARTGRRGGREDVIRHTALRAQKAIDHAAATSFAAGGRLFLLLDYDGTLVRLRLRPEQATMSKRAAALLHRLSVDPRVVVCIVTGRASRSIRNVLGNLHVPLVANHGMEIDIPGHVWIHPSALRARRRLKVLEEKIRKSVGHIPGVLIEQKTHSLTVHVRRVAPGLRKEVLERAARLVRHDPRLVAAKGKSVVEILPRNAGHKGEATLAVLRQYGFRTPDAVVYVGDDRNDEDAFASLRKIAVTVRVGLGAATRAQYRVAGIGDVHALLASVLRIAAASVMCLLCVCHV